jgi:hypothetical protein
MSGIMDASLSTLAILAGLFTGSMGAYFAYRRGRSPYAWFFLGFFFGILGACTVFLAPDRKKKELLEAPKPVVRPPTIQGPRDKFWYYLDPTHQRMGPMSLDALSVAWRQGKISVKTFVWNEELPEWKPLQELITNSP